MDSRLFGPRSFAAGVTWRALFIASLAFALIHVLTETQYYATALVLAGLIAITGLDLTRLYARLGQAAVLERRPAHHAEALAADQTAALLDAVTVALIVAEPDGRIRLANRAARLMAGEEVGRLADIRGLGRAAAQTILGLPTGARQVIAMADGRDMLVWVGAFSAPDTPPRILISLQSVAGELDAVQLKAWRDMTRVLSHEMMNSLTPIASLSESLSHLPPGAVSGDVANALETIGRRSRHLMNFVERYRKLTELPSPDLKPIPLRKFMDDMTALMRPGFAGRGITFRSELKPADLVLNADLELLTQAIINLLHNAAEAVEAMDAPAILFSCAQDGGKVIFRVADNGIGVPPEGREDIFVPFFTTKQTGSGIGLTLARQIAIAHQGQIEADANPGGGMVFRLLIPSPNTSM
jgi:signal transduction histidine kinase